MAEVKDKEMTAEELAEFLKKKAEAEAADKKTAEKKAKAGDAAESDSQGSKDEGTGDATDEAGEANAEAAEAKEETEAAEQDSEKYLRLLAEFQNFKKRVAKEKTDIHAYANEKIVNDLLPVLDNFERALEANPADDPEAYAKGMALILEQMKTALEKAGVKEIAALGETFDPNLHNAVMMEESEEHEAGKISNVLQKGYTLNDKVVRPSMVSVSK